MPVQDLLGARREALGALLIRVVIRETSIIHQIMEEMADKEALSTIMIHIILANKVVRAVAHSMEEVATVTLEVEVLLEVMIKTHFIQEEMVEAVAPLTEEEVAMVVGAHLVAMTGIQITQEVMVEMVGPSMMVVAAQAAVDLLTEITKIHTTMVEAVDREEHLIQEAEMVIPEVEDPIIIIIDFPEKIDPIIIPV